MDSENNDEKKSRISQFVSAEKQNAERVELNPKFDMQRKEMIERQQSEFTKLSNDQYAEIKGKGEQTPEMAEKFRNQQTELRNKHSAETKNFDQMEQEHTKNEQKNSKIAEHVKNEKATAENSEGQKSSENESKNENPNSEKKDGQTR